MIRQRLNFVHSWKNRDMIKSLFYLRSVNSSGYWTGYNVGFDHGLPCRVKNMARGTQ